MDQIKQMLDKLSELDDNQISELQDSIVGEFESVADSGDAPTPQSVEAMTSLADMLDTVKDEVSRRAAQQEELSARAAEAMARVKGGSDEPEASADSDETPAAADTDAADASAEATPEPVAASADVAPEDAVIEPVATEPVVSETSEPEAEVSADEVTEEVASAETTQVAEPVETPAVTEPEVVTPEVEADAPAAEAETEAPVAEDTESASDDAPVEETTPEETEPEAPADGEGESVEADASNSEETPDEQIAQEEAPVTAAAEEAFEAPADRRPVAKVVAPVAITAGADIPGSQAGSSVSDMAGVSELMVRKIHSTRNVNGGDGEQAIVASIETQYPDERTLGIDRDENTTKIDNVVGPQALAASGGFATPLEASYDIFGFGTDVRPVKASLPVFRAERGGVRYLTPPVLSSYANAVGVWTNAMDIQAASNNGSGTDVHKNVLIVGSAQENTAYTDAITLQLQFGNLLTRAFPELIQRHNELALIQHARVAELNLLSKINAASKKVTAAKQVGFARDFLVQIKKAAAAYRSRHRIDPNTQLRAIIPTWVYEAMAADLTLNMPGDGNLGVTRGEIDGFLALSNVTLTASLDQNTFGAQAEGALLDFPGSFTWFLFSEGSFVFLDGGTLDIGIVRDSGLVGTNDYRMFTETFEGLAFVGIESLAITSSIGITGEAAALTDTTPTP